MTVGNKTKDFGSVACTRIYWYYNPNLPPANRSYHEVQGSDTAINISSRVWSGADRAKIISPLPRPKGNRREYIVPEVITKFGKSKTILRKKHFYERPIPTRVKRDIEDVPHNYTVTYNRTCDTVLTANCFNNVSYWYKATGMTVAISNSWPDWTSQPTNPSFNSNDQINLVGKLREKMRGTGFNLAVFLGEGHQAVEMITHTALRLARAGLLARKGQFIQAASVLTEGKTLGIKPRKFKAKTANSWLELQYGWLPLLSDMKAGAEQLAHILHYPKTQRYQVRVKKGTTKYSPPYYMDVWDKASKTVSRNLIAYITEPESNLTVSGLLDPELVAWELLPFSFVADWIIPIGPYLEARAFARRLTGKFVTTDITRQSCFGIKGRDYSKSPTPNYVWRYDNNGAYKDIVSLTRTVSTNLAVPMPQVKPLTKIASWKHMANALALSVNVFKRKSVKGLSQEISKVEREVSSYRWPLTGNIP